MKQDGALVGETPPEIGSDQTANEAESPGSISVPLWIFALAVLATLVPLLLAASPASSDYFTHLSRVAIYYRQGLPLFHDAYHFKLVPIPNLGFDLVVPVLAAFMPLAAAGKGFIALTFILQATGAAAIGYAIQRRLTAASLLLPILVYNLIFSWGFMGYLLGVGLALWGVATYLLLQNRSIAVRVACLTFFAIATYFCHLEAFVLMVVAIVLLEIAGLALDPKHELKPHLQAAGLVFASCLIPAYIHLFVSPVNESVGTILQSPGFWSGDINSLLNPYRTPALSLVHVAVLLGTLLLLVTRLLRIDRLLGWVSLGLLLVYLATPFELYGSAFANTRILPYVAFVFFASLRPAERNAAASRWIAVGAVCILLAQVAFVTREWRSWSAEREGMLAGAAKAPPGTMFVSIEQHIAPPEEAAGIGKKILSKFVKNEPDWQPPTNHATDEVALQGEFLPIQMYHSPGRQPVELDDRYLDLYYRIGSCVDKKLAVLTLAKMQALDHHSQMAAYNDMKCNPIAVSPDNVKDVQRFLVDCDREYRGIRRASGVYPDAGTYVVYVHHAGPAANPMPGLLKPVSEGNLYSVYELNGSEVVAQ